MDDRPHLFELPSWRDPPDYGLAVTVPNVLADLARLPGGIPAALDTDRAAGVFAAACGIPVCEADIEADLIFPQRRYCSRAWLREQYPRFYAWCLEHHWIEAPPPAAPKRGPGRPKKEPATA
jgi:hypothetical protein